MPTMLDPQKIVAIQDRDLATIREEVASSCQYLGHALGFPVKLLVLDANNVVFMAENGIVTAEYVFTEDDRITFDNIKVHDGVENPIKIEKTKALVEAIINDRMIEADQIWPSFEEAHINDFINRRCLEQLSESISFDDPSTVGISTIKVEGIDASRNYFRIENFDCLGKLGELRAKIKEAIENSIDSDEPIGDTFHYTVRGNKKAPKRVTIDRKKRRLSHKYARKNRAAIIRRLKKARQRLAKMFRKPTFRRHMARLRRLNDAHEVDQVLSTLNETIAEEPNIAYLTVSDIAEQVVEALKMEGVKSYTEEFVQEAAKALAIMSRNVYPESRRYITEAALAFLPPSYNTPSDDPFESLEHINELLWEKIDEEEDKKEDVIKTTHELVSSLVDTLTDDIENATNEDEETKEIKSVLEKLKDYRDELAGYDENPGEADLKKVKSILDYIAGIMDVEDEDDEESEDFDFDDDDTGDDDDEENDSYDYDSDDDTDFMYRTEEDEDEDEEEVTDEMKRRKAKNEACTTKTYDMGYDCSGYKKHKKTSRTSSRMAETYDDNVTECDTSGFMLNHAKKSEKDGDPEFYGASGKYGAGHDEDSSQAPYDKSLAKKLFGGGEESLPKSEAHGDYGDHPVSEINDREPLFEGYSFTYQASNALKDLMNALGNDNTHGVNSKTQTLGSNEWKRGKDTYFYELEREDQPDGGIRGKVIKGFKSIGSFYIDRNGYIVKFPGASKTIINKLNQGKERRKIYTTMTTEGNQTSLSVPEQHQKKIALQTLQMDDVEADTAGGMTKEQARKFLKDKCGFTDQQIAKIEESVLVTEEEEVYVPQKARMAVKKWADTVGAVIQFDKTGKAKIPNQHMKSFKASFEN